MDIWKISFVRTESWVSESWVYRFRGQPVFLANPVPQIKTQPGKRKIPVVTPTIQHSRFKKFKGPLLYRANPTQPNIETNAFLAPAWRFFDVFVLDTFLFF